MKNTNCDKAQEWIVAKLDNSLDEEQCISLDNHLAGCATCKAAEVMLCDLWSSLTADTLEDPGEAYWQDYRRSLNLKLDVPSLGGSRTRGFWDIGWKIPAVLAPAALILALVLVGSNGKVPVPQPVDSSACQRLLVELSDVYGPTTEETVVNAYSSRVKSDIVTVNAAVTAGSMLTWFEVEDDPITPYL